MSEKYGFFDEYQRVANYLTAAQIFLKDNFLLERDLTSDDIKARLLGHWGSGPGANFVYMHLSHFVKNTSQDALFVLGPGHAFPALQANLFLEGTLENYYSEARQTYDGIGYLCKNFSWPYGFPSHSNPGTPGVILEGGELGYSLSTAYGAALDNPNLLVACLIGDGEAETGPLATAWHLNKLVNPTTNGAVLPILHLNGYKISGPTVFGRMSDQELISLFTGYGYLPKIIDVTKSKKPHHDMQMALEWAHQLNTQIKSQPANPSWHRPMLILRSPKGWTGVKELNGQKIEGNALSHQVVLTEAKTSEEQLKLLNTWLKSYKFEELFDRSNGFGGFLSEVIPKDPNKRLGASRHARGANYRPLHLPKAVQFSEDADTPGKIGSSSMRRAGLYLAEVFKLNNNENNFRLFSPDETYSNKLDAVFKETTRAWQWPIEPWDKDLSRNGRVMEILSEHNLQGMVQGYILTGRHAIFASYEAFIQVVASMMDQYAKFLSQAVTIPWRGIVPSLNYILTSSSWRQEHNGFSHQNPGFIDDALQRQGSLVTVYFPADGNTTLAALERAMSSVNQINIIVAGKTLEPRWLTPKQALKTLDEGISLWKFASDDNPDIVMAGIGDYLTKEVLVAITLVKKEAPDVKVRMLNISSLTSCGFGTAGTCATQKEFDDHFTLDKPVICNYHGYPETLKAILYGFVKDPKRFTVHGYIERGSTTTPFDMHVRNRTDRYNLAIEMFQKLLETGKVKTEEAKIAIQKFQQTLDANTAYIKVHGVDMAEIEDWKWV